MAPLSVCAWYQYVLDLDVHNARHVHLGCVNALGIGSQEPALIVSMRMHRKTVRNNNVR